MRTIQSKLVRSKKSDFGYTELNSSYYDELLSEDVTVLDHEEKPIFILLKGALSMGSVLKAWSAIEDWHPMSPLRAMAKGNKQRYKYKDGQKTNYLMGRTYCCSGVMGYFDRFPTVPCCRPCAYNAENPEKLELIKPLTAEIAELHERHDPQSWAVYQDFSSKVHKDWKIAGTPYNTITMNKNFQTYPHKDGKNLPATCPMTIIRKGRYRGGHLVFPEHRLAVNIDTTDLILFMNSQEWHGNTRIVGVTKDYVRASLIWYGRKKMGDCLSAKEELKRVNNLAQNNRIKR